MSDNEEEEEEEDDSDETESDEEEAEPGSAPEGWAVKGILLKKYTFSPRKPITHTGFDTFSTQSLSRHFY